MPAQFASRRFLCRTAFTLVELLIVIAIIGTLVALLLPAVGSTRGAARRAECLNNMRNLAQAAVDYESSKGQLPGMSQAIRRGPSHAVGIKRISTPPRWALVTVDPLEASPISWAAKLLPQIERQDLWDQIVDVDYEPEIRPIDVFTCPSDTDATADVDVPALTYSVNAGAPDWDGDDYLADANKGDTTDNGMFFNLYEMEVLKVAAPAKFAALKNKVPANRLSGIRDGAGMTIMLSENVHKSYEPYSPGFPARFSWAFGTEQHLGIVWVVNDNPQPGNTFVDQERINRVADDVYSHDPVFDPNLPRFARPASNHGSGVNVAYCDAHVEFLRDDIDYVVYQQLLTPNGKKCVDPRDWNNEINAPSGVIYRFRTASPLSEADYK